MKKNGKNIPPDQKNENSLGICGTGDGNFQNKFFKILT